MITRNFINAISCGGYIGFSNDTYIGASTIKKINSDLCKLSYNSSTSSGVESEIFKNIREHLFYPLTPKVYTEDLGTESTTMANQTFVYVGSGKTEPTYDDFNLESAISLSKLKVKSHSISKPCDFKSLCNITVVFENISDEDIEVSEIGWFSKCCNGGCDTIVWTLLARDVFDTITIKPGEVRSFVMTIK